MKTEQVLRELEARSDRRLIAVWQRLGMDIRNFYGVSQAQIAQLSKNIGIDHNLAAELWATNIHDARLLAVLIEDSSQITEGQVFLWLNDADYWDLSDLIVKKLLMKLDEKFILRFIKSALKSDKEFVCRSGYIAIGQLAKINSKTSSKNFEVYLNKIASGIKKAENWVVEGMLYALVSIGMKNKSLNRKAVAVARKINIDDIKIEYDSAVRMPDVYEYLTSERAQSRFS